MALFNICGFLAAVVLATLQFTSTEAAHPLLRLSLIDQFVNYDQNQPELPDEYSTQVCAEGVWITYTGREYSIDNNLFVRGVNIFPEMEYNCHNLIIGITRSARFVGLRPDASATSVTLFTGKTFTGLTEIITVGNPIENVAFPIESLVIISSNIFTAEIELFRDADLKGQSICLQPNAKECEDNVCWLFDWDREEVSKLPFNPREAKSVQIGCNINTDVYQPVDGTFDGYVYRNKA